MQNLARLGFVLLGVNIGVQGLAACAAVIYPLFALSPSDSSDLGAGIFVFYVVIALIPSLFLIMRSQGLAERLFPNQSEVSGLGDPQLLMSATLGVMGVYFVFLGATNLLSAPLAALSAGEQSGFAGSLVLYSLAPAVQLIGGVLLALRAQDLSARLVSYWHVKPDVAEDAT